MFTQLRSVQLLNVQWLGLARRITLGSRWFASEAIGLRDYQQHVIDKCIQKITGSSKLKKDGQGEEEDSAVRLGVSLATGGGKTVIFCNLIKQLAALGKCDRALVLVHRRELVQQAAATARNFMPESRILIEMGKSVVCEQEPEAPALVIASVQSLVRRLEKYRPDSFDLIIIDEAHHAVANSYLRVLEHFNRNVPMVGFSATFERADNKALSTVVDEIVYHRGILEMINDKWLCEGKFTQVNVDYDLSDVEISNVTQDFKLEKLSRVMNTEQVNEIILQTYKHKGQQHGTGFQSTLLFAVDIQHVECLKKKFEQNNISVNSVTSATKMNERDKIIRDFKDGRLQVLINCGIFTEGTDMPNIDCILLCRPTRSRSLLIQMIGRGLRLHHSKKHCNIIDFIGASRVGVVSIPTLAGIEHLENTLDDATIDDLVEIRNDFQLQQQRKVEQENLDKESLKKIICQIDTFDLTLSTFDTFQSYHQHSSRNNGDTAASDLLNEINLFYNSKYAWVRFADNAWALSLQNNHHLRIYKKHSKYSLKLYREIPSYLRDTTNTKFVPRELTTDEDLFKVIAKVEEVMTNLADPKNSKSTPKIKNLTKFAKWRYESATEKQKSFIQKRLAAKATEYALQADGIGRFIQRLTKGEASNILFACSLAPVYPIKSLLQVLKRKIEL